VVEADIKSFFDRIDHEKLLEMAEKRVDDRAFIGLPCRFLKAGILMPDGTLEYPEPGAPQGDVVSPVLAQTSICIMFLTPGLKKSSSRGAKDMRW
jgi:RNA-directed DNA polymerase